LRARSLQGLCHLYDENYQLMLRLMPALRNTKRYGEWLAVEATYGSFAADTPALYCRLIECSPYTTTLSLTHQFPAHDDWQADPDLTVRVYHDATQAETLNCGRNVHCEILRQFRGNPKSILERRWQVNMLLNKWLHYLLGQGHRFPVVV